MTGTNNAISPYIAELRRLQGSLNRLGDLIDCFFARRAAKRRAMSRPAGATIDAKPEDPEDLGRQIMAKHNPHYRKGAGRG